MKWNNSPGDLDEMAASILGHLDLVNVDNKVMKGKNV